MGLSIIRQPAADITFIRNALSGCQFHGSNIVSCGSWCGRRRYVPARQWAGSVKVWRHRNEFQASLRASRSARPMNSDCTRLQTISDGITHSGIFGASPDKNRPERSARPAPPDGHDAAGAGAQQQLGEAGSGTPAGAW